MIEATKIISFLIMTAILFGRRFESKQYILDLRQDRYSYVPACYTKEATHPNCKIYSQASRERLIAVIVR